ncbi:hypothetical protein H1S01_15725 [Heliobacterium chlorum]|uniref:Uncharacterized protein n=1 Tax=Heliobacterium chlorum TaxID=2698 RepID=A0ABR7T7J2_HELCL|nr:hypothetical protein [Heliobacterium chlorum]MBC9785935.1 hypothetical protein [Heliobacterium chlorum]
MAQSSRFICAITAAWLLAIVNLTGGILSHWINIFSIMCLVGGVFLAYRDNPNGFSKFMAWLNGLVLSVFLLWTSLAASGV